MTTKEYLLSVKRLDNMINDKLDEIYRIKTRATSITKPYDRERVDGSSDIYKAGNEVVDIVEMEKDVDLLTDILIDTKRNVMAICTQLNPKHADIIIKHYIEYKSISTITEECKYKGIRGCKKAHKRAVEEFEKIFSNTKYCILLDSTLQDVLI